MPTKSILRPRLWPIPLASVLPPHPGQCFITMSECQWDELLAEAYGAGWILLEVDSNENVRRAYRRRDPETN
jgi:hypothetical protein